MCHLPEPRSFEQSIGQALKTTWTLRRPLMGGVGAPMPRGTAIELEISIAPELVEGNPTITIVAGDRRFRVIEEMNLQGEMHNGLFRERRVNGAAHPRGL